MLHVVTPRDCWAIAGRVTAMPTPAVPSRPKALPLVRGLVAAGLATVALSGCFDSDDKGLRAAPVGSTGDSTGTVDPDTSTGLPPRPPIDDGGNGTCAQALGCLGQCIVSVQQQIIMDVPEVDLSCFLECDEELSVEQATLLLRLFECSFEQCSTTLVDDETGAPFCTSQSGTSSSTGGDGGDSGSGSGSGSGSSSTGEPPPPEDPGLFDPCTLCLLTTVNDDDEPNCAELRNMCQ